MYMKRARIPVYGKISSLNVKWGQNFNVWNDKNGLPVF